MYYCTIWQGLPGLYKVLRCETVHFFACASPSTPPHLSFFFWVLLFFLLFFLSEPELGGRNVYGCPMARVTIAKLKWCMVTSNIYSGLPDGATGFFSYCTCEPLGWDPWVHRMVTTLQTLHMSQDCVTILEAVTNLRGAGRLPDWCCSLCSTLVFQTHCQNGVVFWCYQEHGVSSGAVKLYQVVLWNFANFVCSACIQHPPAKTSLTPVPANFLFFISCFLFFCCCCVRISFHCICSIT